MVPRRRRILVATLAGVALIACACVITRPFSWFLVRSIACVPTITVRNDMPTTIQDVEVVYRKADDWDAKYVLKVGSIAPGKSYAHRWWFTDDIHPIEIRFTADGKLHSAESGGYAGRADILQIKVSAPDSVDTYYVSDKPVPSMP